MNCSLPLCPDSSLPLVPYDQSYRIIMKIALPSRIYHSKTLHSGILKAEDLTLINEEHLYLLQGTFQETKKNNLNPNFLNSFKEIPQRKILKMGYLQYIFYCKYLFYEFINICF